MGFIKGKHFLFIWATVVSTFKEILDHTPSLSALPETIHNNNMIRQCIFCATIFFVNNLTYEHASLDKGLDDTVSRCMQYSCILYCIMYVTKYSLTTRQHHIQRTRDVLCTWHLVFICHLKETKKIYCWAMVIAVVVVVDVGYALRGDLSMSNVADTLSAARIYCNQGYLC